MNNIDQYFTVPNIDKNTNFWMIRTKRGFFFDEFLQKQYIAKETIENIEKLIGSK